MIRVIHLMGALNPSGMERMLVAASPYFTAHGVESHIVCQGSNHPYREELIRAGYTVHEIPTVRSAEGFFAFRRILRQIDFDVLHIHTESAFLQAVTAAKFGMARSEVVRTVHNVFTPVGRRARVIRRIKIMITNPFVRFSISPSIDVQINESKQGRYSDVIENWVDDKYFGKSEPSAAENGNQVLFVIVGNCSEVKNHEIVLRELLVAEKSVYHHGSEKHASDREIQILCELETHGLVRYRGVGDPAESLRQGDVFLMPSLSEGMSVALLEAIASGLRVLASDVAGLRWAAGVECVTLIENTPEAWRSAIASASHSPRSEPPTPSRRFRAERGASEYSQMYIRAATRGRL